MPHPNVCPTIALSNLTEIQMNLDLWHCRKNAAESVYWTRIYMQYSRSLNAKIVIKSVWSFFLPFFCHWLRYICRHLNVRPSVLLSTNKHSNLSKCCLTYTCICLKMQRTFRSWSRNINLKSTYADIAIKMHCVFYGKYLSYKVLSKITNKRGRIKLPGNTWF